MKKILVILLLLILSITVFSLDVDINELQKKFPDSKIQVSSSGNNSNKLIAIIKPNNDIIWIMISHNKEFEDLGYDIKEIYNKVGFKLEQKTANMLVMKKNYEGVFFIKGNYKKLYFVHKYINIFEAQNIEKDEGLIESCMINYKKCRLKHLVKN